MQADVRQGVGGRLDRCSNLGINRAEARLYEPADTELSVGLATNPGIKGNSAARESVETIGTG
jgi:hypothetical protein